MNGQEYKFKLNSELIKHSDESIARISNVLLTLPKETKLVSIVISPNQDGDGLFDVFISLDGPDLYVLNRKIQHINQIFSPIHTDEGVVPYIPELDPFDVDFDVNTLLADTVMDWLTALWPDIQVTNLGIPIFINVEEGYGTKPSLKLQ